VTLRAEVPNPQGLLLPGMYVRVQLEQAKANNAILLPQQAVTRSGQGDTVMVVDAQRQGGAAAREGGRRARTATGSSWTA
jgi:membrane fusion protein (multidrug efflux system)